MSLLKNIKTNTKTAWIEFPGLEGFQVHVGAISRELSRKMKDAAEKTVFSAQGHQTTELDEDKFVAEFAKHAVLGWKGLKFKHLEDLMLVDLSGVNPEDDVPYSHDEAIELIKNSNNFDNWLNGKVFSLQTFRNKPKEASGKGTDKVPG